MDLTAIYSARKRRAFLGTASILIAATAAVDWYTQPYVSIGFLYLFPIMLAAGYLRRWQTVMLALVCGVLQESFSNLPPNDSVTRLVLSSAGFVGTGLLIEELLRNRRVAQLHLSEVEEQVRLREQAQQQLRMLIESSPAAIVTVDATGQILVANAAAQQLFAPDGALLDGQSILTYLPALAPVVASRASRSYRASLQCPGTRAGGEVFLAAVWFSTYRTAQGPCLAAIVVDLSEDLRSREELSLDHLLQNARILMSAVSHEIRNLCGAALVVHRNLEQVEALRGNQDFEALGTVIQGLERISSLELKTCDPDASAVDLSALLDELRVLIEPTYREAGMRIRWEVPNRSPLVWADRNGLLHALLNLARNSQRAMQSCEVRLLTVSLSAAPGSVALRFADSGPGVAAPETLFRPFQPHPGGTGLGLYVSRCILRSFGGDLVHEPVSRGCCFAITLVPMQREESITSADADSHPAGR
jgi:two-component system, LuxR family, sensor kinase FixL